MKKIALFCYSTGAITFHYLITRAIASAALVLLIFALGGCDNDSDNNVANDGTNRSQEEMCTQYPTCGVGTVCTANTTCVKIDSCTQAHCMPLEEACALQCGARECQSLESFPVQLRCVDGDDDGTPDRGAGDNAAPNTAESGLRSAVIPRQ